MVRNRIAYGAVAAILLLFIFLNEHPMTYTALYAVLILPLVSLCLTLIFKRRFTTWEELSSNYVVKGDVVQFKFTIENNSFLPCTCVQLRLKSYGAEVYTDFEEKYFSVPPYKKHEVVLNIDAKYRGTYKVGVSNIILYDFLGLFKFNQKHDKSLEFTVNPRILSIPFLPLLSMLQDSAAVRNYKQNEDYSVIADLRKYQPTDGYKKIHWKVSAKRNELISKDFQETEKNAALLLVDNSDIDIQRQGQEALELEDSIVEALVSAMAHCNRLGYPVSLRCLRDSDTDFTADFAYLYRAASGLEFGKFGRFDNFLNMYTKTYGEYMNLIVFVQDINESVFSALVKLRLLGNNVVIFHFNNIEDESRIAQLRDLDVHCVDFHHIQNS